MPTFSLAPRLTTILPRMAGRKKGKYQQGTRVLRMIAALRRRHEGMTVSELAEMFEISTKQVGRDLQLFEDEGCQVERLKSAGELMRIVVRDPPLKRIDLTLRERYALLAVRRMFDVLEHTPLYEDVRNVYAKIAQGFPAERRAEMERMQDRFVYLSDGGRKQYAATEDVLDQLMSGVLYRARVRYAYKNATGKAHVGVLEPFAIVFYRQGLYVVGRKQGGDRLRVFAVERFASAEYERQGRFVVPDDFRVEDHFKGAFGIFAGGVETTRVVVDFTPRVAELVRSRVWHPEQTIVQHEDGGVRLSFEVTDMTQVLSWVLSWGAEARVVAPASLADEIARIGAKLALGPKRVQPRRSTPSRAEAAAGT